MFKLFKFNSDNKVSDNRSPEEKAMDEERAKYDGQVEELAHHINRKDYDDRYPNAKIDKEDVIRNDANVEDQARDLLHIGDISEKDFENLVNNSLKLTDYEWYEEIEGEVSGQKVSIFKRYPENSRYNNDNGYGAKLWRNTLDKPLSEEDEVLFRLHKGAFEKEKELHERLHDGAKFWGTINNKPLSEEEV